MIVFFIAPLWGEKALRSDWLLVSLGIAGAILVVGGNLSAASPVGFLAALVVIVVVSITVHRWRRLARDSGHHPAAAVVVLVLPALLLFPLTSWFVDSPAIETTDIGLYAAGGLLIAIGNICMYLSYQRGWTVVRSLILKPLSALFLVLAGVLFLGDPLTTGTIIGGALILLTTTLVGRQQAATP